jgi:hypothetical protein
MFIQYAGTVSSTTVRASIEESPMSMKPIRRVRVFAIECPSALDMLGNTTESHTLQGVCNLLGHEFASMVVRSKPEFNTALDIITTIQPRHLSKKEQRWPLCVHIATHGDEEGLGFGSKAFDWGPFGERLWKFVLDMRRYKGPLVLILSACCAAEQQITEHFNEVATKRRQPPAYVFATVGNSQGDVYCKDSVVAWSIFYSQISKADFKKQSTIMSIIDKINLVGVGPLKYFRWDSTKEEYRSYESTKKEYTRKRKKASKVNSNGKR